MTPEQLVALFGPLIVFAATWALRKWIIPNVPGWLIVAAVVPVLSALVGWITETLIPAAGTWWALFGTNLLAVFVRELLTQIQSGKNNG